MIPDGVRLPQFQHPRRLKKYLEVFLWGGCWNVENAAPKNTKEFWSESFFDHSMKALARHTFWNITQNLANTAWKEAQFETESRLKNEAEPVSEIHYTPGAPFFAKAGVVLKFWGQDARGGHEGAKTQRREDTKARRHKGAKFGQDANKGKDGEQL